MSTWYTFLMVPQTAGRIFEEEAPNLECYTTKGFQGALKRSGKLSIGILYYEIQGALKMSR